MTRGAGGDSGIGVKFGCLSVVSGALVTTFAGAKMVEVFWQGGGGCLQNPNWGTLWTIVASYLLSGMILQVGHPPKKDKLRGFWTL